MTGEHSREVNLYLCTGFVLAGENLRGRGPAQAAMGLTAHGDSTLRGGEEVIGDCGLAASL